MPRLLELWPSSTPSRECESLPEMSDPVPDAEDGILSEECNDVQESRGSGTRSCASTRPVRWQRRGQRNHRRMRVRVVSWTTTPPFAHAARPLDVSRWKVGGVALGAKSCEDTRSTTGLSNRSWDLSQIRAETRAPSGRRWRNRRFPAHSSD